MPHPYTSKLLKEIKLPGCIQLGETCLVAATIDPELKIRQWDIVLTGHGTVLSEINIQGSLDLVQLAIRKNIPRFK